MRYICIAIIAFYQWIATVVILTNNMKTYIIVGDNNHWYRTITCTEAAAKEELEAIKNDGIDKDEPPSELYLYEAVEISRLTVPE